MWLISSSVFEASLVTVCLSLSQLRTVYYETTAAAQNCNFDVTVDVVGPNVDNSQ